MISRRNMKRHTMLIALFTAFAMLFAIGLATPAQALSLGSITPELSGTTTKLTVNVDTSALPDEFAVASILDSLAVNVTQIVDQSSDELNAYFNLDVLHEDQVALSVGVLNEGEHLLVDIPQLFDTVLAVDLQAVLSEVLAESIENNIALAGLQDLDVDALGNTLFGAISIIEQHTPEAGEGETIEYTITHKSATLLKEVVTYDGDALTAIIQEIVEFLRTDEGMASIFEKVIQPMSEGEFTDLDGFLESMLGEAAGDLQEAELSIGVYTDENGVTAGYHFVIGEADDDDFDDALVLDLILLGEEDDFEAELLIAADGELARIVLLGGVGETGAFDGTLTLYIHEGPDKASDSQPVVIANFVDVNVVPFGSAVMITGTIEVVTAADGGEITLLYTMTEKDGTFVGSININNAFELGIETRELTAEELVIPESFKTKDKTTIKSLDGLEVLFTEDVQMRLFTVLQALGIPLDGMIGE